MKSSLRVFTHKSLPETPCSPLGTNFQPTRQLIWRQMCDKQEELWDDRCGGGRCREKVKKTCPENTVFRQRIQNINIQGHFASKNSPNPYSHHFRKTTNKTIKTWKQISIFCLRVSFIKMSLPMAIVFSQVSGTGRFLLSEKN